MGVAPMPQDDTPRWVRTYKLAAVAGVLALGYLVAGAFVADDSARLYGWAGGAGIAFSAMVALIDAYWRKGPLDTSGATRDTNARKVWAAIVAVMGLAGAASWLFERFVLLQGFASGVLFFALLVFSPLFRPSKAPSSSASFSSRTTASEGVTPQEHNVLGSILVILKASLVFLTIVTWVFCVLTVVAVNESAKCAGHDFLLGNRSELSDLLAPGL
jgi:hypothetical protein